MLLTAVSTRRTHRHGEAAGHSHTSPLVSSLVEPVALILGIIGCSREKDLLNRRDLTGRWSDLAFCIVDPL